MEYIAMRLVSATTGAVSGETLVYNLDGQTITVAVDSTSWYDWLETATSFTFRSAQGKFTAHKERASNHRGGWYWRAYRQRQGKLTRFYLGVSTRVTLERLQAAAAYLEQNGNSASQNDGPPLPLITAHASPAENSSILYSLPPQSQPLPLLATKLLAPPLPAQHVPRLPGVALLEESSQRALTLVCAPAGSGKSTLLAEWAGVTTLSVAWLSLEAADDEPVRFLSYLRAALAHITDRGDEAMHIDSFSPISSWEQVMTDLLNDLARLLQRDAVVVLDDYHLVTSTVVQDITRFLLDHLPPRLHLVIGTRVDPPLPLARLRARGQLGELGIADLRFVAEEVAAFVKTMDLTLSDEATSLLEQRTEGWIAGIQLLALSLRRHADAAAFLRAFRGTHRFFLDYVSEEVLAQQTPEVRRFLLQTSVLGRMTGPLCDAVTGGSDGQAQLVALLRANLFVSALDDTQTWYRYHALFAEALRDHLGKQEPELIPELYRRASLWYEQQQQGEEACEYAFLADDLPRAAALLAELVPYLMAQGKFTRMIQWLDRIPAELVAMSPKLYLASTWMQPLRTGTPMAMEKLMEQLEWQIREHGSDDPVFVADARGELMLQQAMTALARGDISQTLSLAEESLQTPVKPESAWNRFFSLRWRMVLGAAYRSRGDLEAAEKVLLEAAPTGDAANADPLNMLVFLSLSELYEGRGQLHKLGQLYEKMFQSLAEGDDPSSLFSALAHARYAMLLYEWNRLDKTERHVQYLFAASQRLELPLSIPIFDVFSLQIQVNTLMVRGRDSEARRLLEGKVLEMKQWQIPEFEHVIGTMVARLSLSCGLLDIAWNWQKVRGLRFDDTLDVPLDSMSYSKYIVLARVLFAHGRRGRNQRDVALLSQARQLLERLHVIVVDMGFSGWCIEVQMLTALVLLAQGKIKQALLLLGPVLEQAEPEGYVRLFADEGHPMEQLLAQVVPYTAASPTYVQRLLTAIPHSQDISPTGREVSTSSLNPLSAREQEVLRLLAAGYSNQQIADQLVISLNTVKRHVKHILNKLVATSRTQALARARELHLL